VRLTLQIQTIEMFDTLEIALVSLVNDTVERISDIHLHANYTRLIFVLIITTILPFVQYKIQRRYCIPEHLNPTYDDHITIKTCKNVTDLLTTNEKVIFGRNYRSAFVLRDKNDRHEKAFFPYTKYECEDISKHRIVIEDAIYRTNRKYVFTHRLIFNFEEFKIEYGVRLKQNLSTLQDIVRIQNDFGRYDSEEHIIYFPFELDE
jgi:hypothetical protein